MMRIGMNIIKRMGPAFAPLVEYRREYMSKNNFLYLEVVGVASEFQGKGYGRKLIEVVTEKADREGIQLLVGAGSEENVMTYERFGFKVIKEIILPIINLPDWEMIREPQV
jgi:GNAT superfamily N-acetyltransferase